MGGSLPESVRVFYESRLYHEFSQVRMHTDAAEAAQAVNARAFTVGQDVSGRENMHRERIHKTVIEANTSPPQLYILQHAAAR